MLSSPVVSTPAFSTPSFLAPPPRRTEICAMLTPFPVSAANHYEVDRYVDVKYHSRPCFYLSS